MIRLSGLLATAIIKMEGVGGLAGWRWIFILEGIATILSSIIAALVLPAGIISAKFLTEEERAFARMLFYLKTRNRSAEKSWMITVRRFRAADTVSTSTPLSEGAESITAHASDTEKEGENTEVREHAHIAKAPSIHQEDEEFEWREIVRGLTDLQTWLTGFAYFGLLVSLYSFSLFL
jgi:MFS family permease